MAAGADCSLGRVASLGWCIFGSATWITACGCSTVPYVTRVELFCSPFRVKAFSNAQPLDKT